MSEPQREILVGLCVTDDKAYDAYRAGMTPILHAMGGAFRRDFRVSEVLGEGEKTVNRLFVLSFPSAAVKEAFFSDPAYQAVRAEHFAPSVAHADIIAEYDIPA